MNEMARIRAEARRNRSQTIVARKYAMWDRLAFKELEAKEHRNTGVYAMYYARVMFDRGLSRGGADEDLMIAYGGDPVRALKGK